MRDGSCRINIRLEGAATLLYTARSLVAVTRDIAIEGDIGLSVVSYVYYRLRKDGLICLFMRALPHEEKGSLL